MIPLFAQYPQLRDRLPYISLGDFPTPVTHLRHFGREVKAPRIYMKRDDISGRVYGGNKVRKLEFLLAQARQAGIRTVLTYGAAGSHHTLATALYSQQVGIASLAMLIDQPPTEEVCENMRAMIYYGAQLYHSRSMAIAPPATLFRLVDHRRQNGHWPQRIPPGGSSALAGAGFVNAALELKEQIVAGHLPEPDNIYVATGTMGTAAGLLLGLRLAGLRSRLIAVRVAARWFVNRHAFGNHLRRINRWLNRADRSLPMITRPLQDLSLRHQFAGRGYAYPTPAGQEAIQLMADLEGIPLEGTYTGKTVAALLADLHSDPAQRGRVHLFWNTVNSRDISTQASVVDIDQLPRSLQVYCSSRHFNV